MLDKLYRGADVALILGISKALAYRLLAEGAIPSVRFGRTVRVRPEDLAEFILTHINKNKMLLSKNEGDSYEYQR